MPGCSYAGNEILRGWVLSGMAMDSITTQNGREYFSKAQTNSFCILIDKPGESQHYRHGCRGAARDITVNGDHVSRAVRDCVASFIDAAVHGAVAAGQDQP